MEKNSTMYYYHADGLGSIVALTNSNGSVAQAYTYDSFGNITSGTPTITQPYTYTAREYDPETGLYFYRARYYDPKAGRFLTRDPIGFKGGINVYIYAGNNPINISDALGLMGGKPDWSKARPNIPFYPPNPPPCDPFTWCKNEYDKKLSLCLVQTGSPLCGSQAKLWYENCAFWAGGIGDNSQGCSCD
jgi:RHS repeat-associated protein